MSVVKPEELTNTKPQKSLLAKKKRKFGRSHGKISVRHIGGGNKKRLRLIDFNQDKKGIPGKIVSIEKDPFRSALIALVVYKDGEKRYVLASQGMKVGEEIIADDKTSVKPGNRMRMENIPVGTVISNIEIIPGRGGQVVRSAGSGAVLMGIDKDMVQVKMASGEIRLFDKRCWATVGQVSNFEHNSCVIGKAGRKRWMGVRPTVRGTAMNPVDHPHGGGEGRQPLGMSPKTPWGKPALGKKTRKKFKYSDKFIVKRRKK